jgi:hypothetical protein
MVRGWWGCVYAGPDVGSYVVVDTAVGRLKERNTRRDPRVALAVPDWEDPYTYVEIRIGFKLFLMLSIFFSSSFMVMFLKVCGGRGIYNYSPQQDCRIGIYSSNHTPQHI